ncbi:MAG: ABC transporter permease [Acidobacteriota bacterium]|nr:ABC transporter permease [Acidobacteriota bacterium]
MGRVSQFGQLTRTRIVLLLREPEAVFWILVFPLLLTMVLGWAFRDRSPEHLPVAVLSSAEDAARGEDSSAEQLAEKLAADPLLDVTISTDSEMTREQLRFGKIAAYVEPGDPPTLSLDPQRPDAEIARLRLERALLNSARTSPDSVVTFNEIRETGSRYIDWLFPGILGMNLMGTGIWGIGFAIADMRQKKLIRRLLVTPMRKGAFLLSFLSGRLVFLVIELALIGGFGFLILRVPLRGSLIVFLVICIVGMVTFASLGLLTVTRARTIEGASGLMNLVVMPMWLLSGVFFSYERFPEVLHPILRALPLTALNDALRANALEGANLLGVLPQLGVMAGWSLVTFALSLAFFRWE